MLDSIIEVAFDERPDILSPEVCARVFQLGLRSTIAYTWQAADEIESRPRRYDVYILERTNLKQHLAST